MQFKYTPEGAKPRVWQFSPEKLMSPEAEMIEKITKMTFGEWADALERNSMLALRALLYVLLKRDQPTLQPDQLQLSLSEVELVLELDDKIRARDEIRESLANGSLDIEKREIAREILVQLDLEIAEEQGQLGVEPGDEAPKVEPSFATTGGQHSATPGAGTPDSSTT